MKRFRGLPVADLTMLAVCVIVGALAARLHDVCSKTAKKIINS